MWLSAVSVLSVDTYVRSLFCWVFSCFALFGSVGTLLAHKAAVIWCFSEGVWLTGTLLQRAPESICLPLPLLCGFGSSLEHVRLYRANLIGVQLVFKRRHPEYRARAAPHDRVELLVHLCCGVAQIG